MSLKSRLARFAAAAVLVLGLCSSNAFAMTNQSSCTRDLALCMAVAATYDSFVLRAAAGIDCGIDYVSCVRHVIWD